mmetsp:Transcript_79955/g.231104  ORF Transcript_79955/g.231104 Transcript_79955/m.231104 type:complete len:83 (-) Transcript_79955:660-908(-)
MRLLNFIKEYYSVRSSSNCFGELSTFIVPNVAGWCSNQSSNRVLLRVLRHVDSCQMSLITIIQLCKQGLGEFCLSNTRGSKK